MLRVANDQSLQVQAFASERSRRHVSKAKQALERTFWAASSASARCASERFRHTIIPQQGSERTLLGSLERERAVRVRADDAGRNGGEGDLRRRVEHAQPELGRQHARGRLVDVRCAHQALCVTGQYH